MIQPDGEAEQLSLDYRGKANDYRWIVNDYQATIAKKPSDYQTTIDYAPRVSAENFFNLKTEQKAKQNRRAPIIGTWRCFYLL